MNIRPATTDEDVQRCYPVMRQLRLHLSMDAFCAQVKRQQADGYHLVMVERDDGVVAVAGYCIGESLAWGKHLYVHDMVTDKRHRSSGIGGTLLQWLGDEAKRQGCGELRLDSGVQRAEAHRFYLQRGMTMPSYHFKMPVD